MVPFAIGLDQALHDFEEWNASHWLAPRKLLTNGTSHISTELLPFWLFEVTASVHYSGRALDKVTSFTWGDSASDPIEPM